MNFSSFVHNFIKSIGFLKSIVTKITWETKVDEERDNKALIYIGNMFLTDNYYTVQQDVAVAVAGCAPGTWSWVLVDKANKVLDTRIGYVNETVAKVGAQDHAYGII